MAFFAVIALLLASCQMSPSQPADNAQSQHPPFVGKNKNNPWTPIPIFNPVSKPVDYSEILDFSPVAKDMSDTLKSYGLQPVRAEKIGFVGTWLNGEGMIGVIRFESANPQEAGAWLIVGNGFGGKTVTLLLPRDDKESEYEVWVQAESTGIDFELSPLVVKSRKYENYREYANSASSGGFGAFFGSLSTTALDYYLHKCERCSNAAYDFLLELDNLETSIQDVMDYRNLYAGCCSDYSTGNSPHAPSVSTWHDADNALVTLAPPSVPSCGYSGDCFSVFRDWVSSYQNARRYMRRSETYWQRMKRECGLCSPDIGDSLRNWRGPR